MPRRKHIVANLMIAKRVMRGNDLLASLERHSDPRVLRIAREEAAEMVRNERLQAEEVPVSTGNLSLQLSRA